MRDVDFSSLRRRVSALGFGCASLGSRVDAKRGLAALDRAFDSGVMWFDVAPSYGDGNAELILGSFLREKRNRAVVCTKVGMLPASISLAERVVKPIAQRILPLAPRLRHVLVKTRTAPKRVPLTGTFVEASVSASLKRLGTDYIDVLALHEPNFEDLEREDVLRALENSIIRGQAQTVAIAGEPGVGLKAIELSNHIRILQLSNSPFAPNVQQIKQRTPKERQPSFVMHSILGVRTALDQLVGILEHSSQKQKYLREIGYSGNVREAAAAFLLDFSMVSDSQGVLLLSMYQPQHLRFAVDRIVREPDPASVSALASQLLSRPE